MKLYFAGSDRSVVFNDILKEAKVQRRLLSYFYAKTLRENTFATDIFIDSGAFTAWTSKKAISIDDYIAFIKENRNQITAYANLDVIGNPQGSLDNYDYMVSKGLSPLPVFHIGSPFSFLDAYLDRGCRYIALGAMVGKRKEELFPWLDKVFAHLRPFWEVKTHAFGITNADILSKYPFYSCDSTAWLTNGRYGHYDKYKNGKVVKRNDEVGKRLVKLSVYQEKARTSVYNYLKLEKYITDLWKIRGIVWK